jgi:O-antigen/teichoic acid export membrane protein
MQILLLSLAVSSANTTSGGIVYGMEKHKRIAIWAIVEAIANLALSLVLVRRMGIVGVAWGTAIPSVTVELLLWPSYVCKLLNMRTRTYIWQVWIRTTLGVVPFGLGCLLVERFWPVHSLAAFFGQIALLLPLFPLTLALIFRREIMAQAPGWIQRWRVSRRVRNEYQPSTTAVS